MSERRDMGMSKLLGPNAVFVRKFRWVVSAEHLHKIAEVSFQSVDFLLKPEKQIALRVLELVQRDNGSWLDVPVLEWLEKLPERPDEALVFTTFDGCGYPIYECRYTGLEVVSTAMNFDYAVSDVSTIDIVLKYQQMERKFLMTEKPILPEITESDNPREARETTISTCGGSARIKTVKSGKKGEVVDTICDFKPNYVQNLGDMITRLSAKQSVELMDYLKKMSCV